MNSRTQVVALGIADCIEQDFDPKEYASWSNLEKYFSLLEKSWYGLTEFLQAEPKELASFVTDIISIEAQSLGRSGYGYTIKDANKLGFSGFSAHTVDLGGASVCGSLVQAYQILQANPEAVVLLLAADVPKSAFRQIADLKRLTETVCDPDLEIPYGSTLIGFYSLLANRIMQDSKISPSDLEEITKFFRSQTISNPRAFSFQKELNEKSFRKPLAGSYSTPMVAIVTDHGFASLFTSQKKANWLKEKGILQNETPVCTLAGVGSVAYTEYFAYKKNLMSPAGLAAEKAFSMSGISRESIQYAWIYDCFTGMMISQASQYFGISPKEISESLKQGKISNGRELIPINAGGGILNYQAAMSLSGATGLLDILSQYNLAKNPIPVAVSCPKFALLGGNGGIDSVNTVALFSKDANESEARPSLKIHPLEIAKPTKTGGIGVITGATTVHFNPGGTKKPPYVLVSVALEDGTSFLGNLWDSSGKEILTDSGLELGKTKVRVLEMENLLQAQLFS